jgi:hypothetical protein
MAAYPTLGITTQSQSSRVDGLVAVRATNGTLKMRKTMTGEKYEFTLEHELTQAQRDSVEAHYQGDKLNSFNYTWPLNGTTYTCRYLAAPLFVYQPGGWYKATVRLGEV